MGVVSVEILLSVVEDYKSFILFCGKYLFVYWLYMEEKKFK